MGGGNSRAFVKEYVQDPQLVALLETLTMQNFEMFQEFQDLIERMAKQEIETFDDLVKYDKKGAEAWVELAHQTPVLALQGRNFGFFGITGTGKSTLINHLLDKNVAATGYGGTTMKIQGYAGGEYTLYDFTGHSIDVCHFSMEFVSFCKSCTGRIVLVNATLKEMRRLFLLLDAIGLQYDIVVNKFDLVEFEKRDEFKEKIRSEVTQCQLKGVKNIWFVSDENPKQFLDWLTMVDHLTS